MEDMSIASVLRDRAYGNPLGALNQKVSMANPLEIAESQRQWQAEAVRREKYLETVAIVSVAEGLVVNHNANVSEALEKAKELWGAAQELLAKFSPPKNDN